MSEILCSVMIPSRKGIARLLKTLASINLSATSPAYEILIRLDDDDADSLSHRALIEAFHNVRVFTGPRLGYAMLDEGYYTQLAAQAAGKWVWICGDDCIVSGDWLGELAKVPMAGYFVQPEVSKLGYSTYPKAEDQAFPIIVQDCWKAVGFNCIPRGADVALMARLRQVGWKTWFLNGVTMWHDQKLNCSAECLGGPA